MNYLGVDYGGSRVGLAVSDPNSVFALPLQVLENSRDLIDQISEICKDRSVDLIVVGESHNFSQKENEIMKEIKPFVKRLREETGLIVEMHPEFMTSLEAERLQGSNDMNDASAAAIILKSYLDTKASKL